MSTTDWGLGSGLFGIDNSVLSGTDAVPLPDNSLGWPIQQPADPTGNGSGQFIDMTLSDLLKTGLNYSIAKDQQALQQQQVPVTAQASAVQSAAAQKSSNTRMLIIGAAVLVAAVLIAKA